MVFQEYKPSKLNDLVISIYERKVSIPMKVRFLPDSHVTLIFNLGKKIKSAQGENVDSKVFNPTSRFCFISGLHTKPLYFDMEGLHVVGLILHPMAVKSFFGLPTEKVKDMVIEWDTGLELAYIEDRINELPSFMERAIWLENYFHQKLSRVDGLHLAMKLRNVVVSMKRDVLEGHRPDIMQYSGYSKMHTHRMFKDWLGLTPGKLLRYQQFLHAISLMHKSDHSLTQIGLESGFYDQAHFIRVFEEFADMTPGHYKKHKTPLPGILPW